MTLSIKLTQDQARINYREMHSSEEFGGGEQGHSVGEQGTDTTDVFSAVLTVTKHFKSLNAN